MEQEGSQRFTSEHCMMYPWQPLCQVTMINKPNDIFIPVVDKVGFQISED